MQISGGACKMCEDIETYIWKCFFSQYYHEIKEVKRFYRKQIWENTEMKMEPKILLPSTKMDSFSGQTENNDSKHGDHHELSISIASYLIWF